MDRCKLILAQCKLTTIQHKIDISQCKLAFVQRKRTMTKCKLIMARCKLTMARCNVLPVSCWREMCRFERASRHLPLAPGDLELPDRRGERPTARGTTSLAYRCLQTACGYVQSGWVRLECLRCAGRAAPTAQPERRRSSRRLRQHVHVGNVSPWWRVFEVRSPGGWTRHGPDGPTRSRGAPGARPRTRSAGAPTAGPRLSARCSDAGRSGGPAGRWPRSPSQRPPG